MASTSLGLLALGQLASFDLQRQSALADRRSIGQRAIGLIVHPNYQAKPIHEQRFAVAIMEWRGDRWARWRRLTGPKTLAAAREECDFQSRHHGMQLITEI